MKEKITLRADKKCQRSKGKKVIASTSVVAEEEKREEIRRRIRAHAQIVRGAILHREAVVADEEKREEIRRRIRAHAQIVRGAILHREAGKFHPFQIPPNPNFLIPSGSILPDSATRCWLISKVGSGKKYEVKSEPEASSSTSTPQSIVPKRKHNLCDRVRQRVLIKRLGKKLGSMILKE